MNLSKRQFLKVGLGGVTGLLMSRFLKPASLMASPIVVPASYLQSDVHHYWMKLSYNDGKESRRIRRLVGVALRQAIPREFQGPCFDRGVEKLYRRFQDTGQKPGSLFALVQELYSTHIHPCMGVEGGYYLFGTYLSMLRGQDGSALGQEAHHAYLNYREAVLAHKNLYRQTKDPKEQLPARRRRTLSLNRWREQLLRSVVLYAYGELRLNPAFLIQPDMLAGFDLNILPAPRLCIASVPNGVIVTWKGGGRLQYAPKLAGPWTDSTMTSPAKFGASAGHLFFRAVQE